MGSGFYSNEAYQDLRSMKSYDHKSRDQIFVSRNLAADMDPRQAAMRVCHDSTEHPNSLPIIVGLDVTGSMGFIPEDIVKNTLPDLMGTMIQAGVTDPQVLFMGLGDFVYDRAPLQVGQFESSAELLDRWLTRVYLEGGGGGNNCESYNLAYLFAARHTEIHSWEKRLQKGFLFTIGDEPCASSIPASVMVGQTAAEEGRTISTMEILDEAQQRYEVFHLHVEHNAIAKTDRRKGDWKELLGENFIELSDYQQVAKVMADLVLSNVKPLVPSSKNHAHLSSRASNNDVDILL